MCFLRFFALLTAFTGLISCRSAVENNRSGDIKTPTSVDSSVNSAAVEPAGEYEKDGVSFVLRKNWKVTEDEDMGGGIRYLNVEDENNATVAVTFLPTGADSDLKKYADEFTSRMQTNLSGGKITETGESETVRRAANIEKKGWAKKYSISLSGETVPHTAEVFFKKGRKYDAILVYNAPDDEKSTADAGFETVLYTLKAR